LFQVGTEFVTPTEGWLDVPIDGAVTVPTVCPELPIVPCCTGAPERPLVLPGVPVADVCALTASGAAANPRATSAAMERFVVVMANPFGGGLSIAMPFVEALVHRVTLQLHARENVPPCHPPPGSTLHHDAAKQSPPTDWPWDRRIAEGIPLHFRNGVLTGFLSFVSARTAAKPKQAPHIRME
jgi:hypothetical protein